MSIEIQQNIKNNSRSVSDYFSDLVKWEEEESKKETRRDAAKKGVKPNTVKKAVVPPPRGSGADEKEDSGQRSEEAIARDKMPMPHYYHNWDQYNVEEEVEQLEEQEDAEVREVRQQRQADKDRILDDMAFNGDGDRVRTTKARPRVKMNIRVKGRPPAPVDLAKPKKEEANNLFAQGRFKEAMVAYSTALDYLEKYEPPGKETEAKEEGPNEVSNDPIGADATQQAADGSGQETEAIELKVTLLANRAQALIKIEEWREAVMDCSEALRFNPKHHKATLRRGFALAKMKRWGLAARDLSSAVENDPSDRKAAAELKMARRNLAEQAKEVRAHAKTIISDTTREPTMPTRKVTVKVRRPGSAFEKEPNVEASAAPAAAAPAFQPQPRGAEGKGARAPADIDALLSDEPLQRPAAATVSTAGTGARQPYVPRSVRIRGRQPVPEATSVAAETSSLPSSTPAADPEKPSMNFYTFEAQWNRHSKKPKERAALLRKIGAAALPALFRESLDAELVTSIIAVLSSELSAGSEGAVTFASSVLGALSRTQRFKATLEQFSVEERSCCEELMTALESCPDQCVEDSSALRQAFEPPPPRLPRLPDQDDDEEEDEDDRPQSADFIAPTNMAIPQATTGEAVCAVDIDGLD